VSATTRPMRPGERDGVHYHFLTPEEFRRREAAGEFVEWATYNGNLYGTLRAEVEKVFAEGRHVLLDIEIEGARQVRACFANSVHVFVLPPSADALVGRLAGRQTEQASEIAQRLVVAAEELAAVAEYDYVVVNDILEEAVDQVASILTAESRRVARQGDLVAALDGMRREILVRAAEFAAPASGAERTSRT
jgi:guanylate kinase